MSKLKKRRKVKAWKTLIPPKFKSDWQTKMSAEF